MNREKDFHKKASGTIVNMNTKDFHRAKTRNRIMREARGAFGDDGTLIQVTKKVDEFANAPSRAENRVVVLEEELAKTKALNEKMEEQLLANTVETKILKDTLKTTVEENELMKEHVQEVINMNTELLKVQQRLDKLENK